MEFDIDEAALAAAIEGVLGTSVPEPLTAKEVRAQARAEYLALDLGDASELNGGTGDRDAQEELVRRRVRVGAGERHRHRIAETQRAVSLKSLYEGRDRPPYPRVIIMMTLLALDRFGQGGNDIGGERATERMPWASALGTDESWHAATDDLLVILREAADARVVDREGGRWALNAEELEVMTESGLFLEQAEAFVHAYASQSLHDLGGAITLEANRWARLVVDCESRWSLVRTAQVEARSRAVDMLREHVEKNGPLGLDGVTNVIAASGYTGADDEGLLRSAGLRERRGLWSTPDTVATIPSGRCFVEIVSRRPEAK